MRGSSSSRRPNSPGSLHESETWASTSSTAGTTVTSPMKKAMVMNLPSTYCATVTGRDRYSSRALARRSSLISPAPTIRQARNTKIHCMRPR